MSSANLGANGKQVKHRLLYLHKVLVCLCWLPSSHLTHAQTPCNILKSNLRRLLVPSAPVSAWQHQQWNNFPIHSWVPDQPLSAPFSSAGKQSLCQSQGSFTPFNPLPCNYQGSIINLTMVTHQYLRASFTLPRSINIKLPSLGKLVALLWAQKDVWEIWLLPGNSEKNLQQDSATKPTLFIAADKLPPDLLCPNKCLQGLPGSRNICLIRASGKLNTFNACDRNHLPPPLLLCSPTTVLEMLSSSAAQWRTEYRWTIQSR